MGGACVKPGNTASVSVRKLRTSQQVSYKHGDVMLGR